MKAKDKAFSKETKKEAMIMARGKCEHCGNRAGLQFHHKKKRSTYDAQLASIKNCAVLCYKCHDKADNPKGPEEKVEMARFRTSRWQEVGETEYDLIED